MNSSDWESKFNAIVRDTVHNLDRVKVCIKIGLSLFITNVGFHCWMLLLSVATSIWQLMILHRLVSTISRLFNIERIILLQQSCMVLKNE